MKKALTKTKSILIATLAFFSTSFNYSGVEISKIEKQPDPNSTSSQIIARASGNIGGGTVGSKH